MVFEGKALVIDDVVKGRYIISSKGEIYDAKYNKIVSGHLNTGYMRITLMQENKKQKSYYIHVLVAVMFIEDLHLTQYVNHIDGDKLNNDVSNLEWVTHRENMRHAMNTGLLNRKPLIEEDVRNICELRQDGKTSREISGILNIPQKTVEGITNGHNWKDISSEYAFPEKKPRTFLDIHKIKQICELFALNYTIKEIADELGVPYPTIASIRQKVSHKEVSDNYF